MKPLFEERALATAERAQAIYAGRGTQYGDTWRECQFLKMKACARELGVEIPDKFMRALATAAFCDMKYWRLLGGYHDDSIIDGINYDSFLAEEMRVLVAARNRIASEKLTADIECILSAVPKCDSPSITDAMVQAGISPVKLSEDGK